MSEWIKCSDRLPKDGCFVLVYDGDTAMCEWNGEYFGVRVAGENWKLEPTHWQPLPEPPKDFS